MWQWGKEQTCMTHTWISSPSGESKESTGVRCRLDFVILRWNSLKGDRVRTLRLNMSAINTGTRLTQRHLTFLPVRLRSKQTNVVTPVMQSRAPVIQRAASSYNNIALWRSPERTGKCCLCPSAGEGVALGAGLFVQPQHNRPARGWKGEAEERPGRGVQRGRCIPAGFTFGVNKVRTPARGTATAMLGHFNSWRWISPMKQQERVNWSWQRQGTML